MNQRPVDMDVTEAVEKLKQKYFLERKQFLPSNDISSGTRGAAVQRLISEHRSKQPSTELKDYNEALQELFKAVNIHSEHFGSDRSPHGINEDHSVDSTAVPLHDSQLLFTETDMTLPSYLDGSPPVLQDTKRDRQLQRTCQSPDSCGPSSYGLAKVYQELMIIYEQLKAERQIQQHWERELHERERRLKQQEEAFGRLAGLEETIHARSVAVEQKHQQELSQLQDLLRERIKENKRIKSSLDTIKGLNDDMRKKLNEINEQNKKLESQSKRVQARLENLQRKYEHSIASRRCQKGSVKGPECIKSHKKEKAATSGKLIEKSSLSLPSPKLLVLLLDWVLDGQIFSSVAGNAVKDVGQRLPPEALLSERCLKVLPLLADQLHHTPSSESNLILNLLRLIYWALRYLDDNTQHAALCATQRQIGDEVSKSAVQSTVLQPKDPDLPKSCIEASGPLRSWPLYQSLCPHTRVLSILIIFCTITQADVLAQALDSLHTELMCEESRGLYIHYGGVHVLLSLLQAGHAGLRTSIDILMQLTEQSRYLNRFLEACSCEDFFRTASHLIKNPRLELPSLEKISIILQKLSSIRKNRHLFERFSLHLQIQELHHKMNPSHTFLCLNLRSILLNLR